MIRAFSFQISFTRSSGALPTLSHSALGAANALLLRLQLYETLDINRESGIEKPIEPLKILP